MAQILISGTIKDPNLDVPVSGQVTFILSNYFIATDGRIVPQSPESCVVDPATGAFSIHLESTTDSYPADRTYTAVFTGTLDGQPVSVSVGSFALPPSPASVLLTDLITLS
jgi:hypothetical protein